MKPGRTVETRQELIDLLTARAADAKTPPEVVPRLTAIANALAARNWREARKLVWAMDFEDRHDYVTDAGHIMVVRAGEAEATLAYYEPEESPKKPQKTARKACKPG